MVAENNPNLRLIQTAAAKLAPLLGEIAFLGGCAAGLLITDRAAAPVRSTVDVDVIAEIVVDGRPELAEEVRASEAELKAYLRRQFKGLVGDPSFVESIQGHLLPDEASQERTGDVLRVLRQFAVLE